MTKTAKTALSTLALTLACAAAGCGGFKVNLPDRSGIAGERDYVTFAKAKKDARLYWLLMQKHPAEGQGYLEKAIESWKTAFAIDERDREAPQQLALCHYYLAYYFVKDEEKRNEIYQKGFEYAAGALVVNPLIKAAYEADPESLHEAVVQHATVGDVPGAYWLAVLWSRVMEHGSLAQRATDAPKVKAVMEWVYGVGEGYHNFAVYRYFGAYYCKAPGQADPGGQSKEAFEKAIEKSPELLENKILMAEYYCVLTADEERFEELLNEVLAAPDGFGPPELQLENYYAKKKAKRMLDDMYVEYF